MNFLAHIYLSGNNDMLKIGNFMADSVRGHHYLDYPDEIRKGILLHRYIDTFTDAHPIYRKSKHRLHEKYGHYSGVIMDIVYDHFLAKNWNNYSDEKNEQKIFPIFIYLKYVKYLEFFGFKSSNVYIDFYNLQQKNKNFGEEDIYQHIKLKLEPFNLY